MNSTVDIVNFAASVGGTVIALLGLLLNLSLHYLDRQTRRFFTILFVLLLAYVASSLTTNLLLLSSGHATLSRLGIFAESLFSSMLMPMLTMYLLHCAGVEWKRHPAFLVVTALWCAYFVLLVVTQFTTSIYTVTPENVYQRGPLYPLLLIPPVLLMLVNLTVLLRCRKSLTKRELLAFSVYLLLPLGCMLVQMVVYGLLMIVIGTSFAALFLFVSIVLDQVESYVAQQREIARQQREIARERASVMVLRMRPHFIYNTLTSIYSLINQDAKKARQVTKDFINYLQKNFNAVASDGAVPFTTELEHSRAYLAVEQAQHEDMLVVDFDTPVTQFRLPPLTLQPLVENAVKHGFAARSGPLHVSVRTRKTDGDVEIIVEDNGPGFDPNDKSKPHPTLDNISQRLDSMCGGTMQIERRETGGTKVTVSIPTKQPEEERAGGTKGAARRNSE